MNFMMFCLGAGSLFVGMLIHPWIMKIGKWLTKLGKTKVVIEDTVITRISYLEHKSSTQQKEIDNLAERLSTRDVNRKNNTRREVRNYLSDLQTK